LSRSLPRRLAVLGALFAGTVRKAGSDLGSAATTVAANQVAELVRRWLGPDHPVSVALEEAQQRPRDRHPPATLEETLRGLAETKPEFVVELRRLLDPPPPPSITFGGPVNQYGPVNVIGQATINAGSIGGPSADAPDVVVGQPPDSAEGSANPSSRARSS
jgi:hypothetical protein